MTATTDLRFPYFELTHFRAAPRELLGDAETVRAQYAARARDNGGHLFGFWRSLNLGLPRDDGIAMTAWPSESAARDTPAVADARTHHVRATVRPTTDDAPSYQGIYVFRWFDLASADWDDFLALSDEAWPHMEQEFDVNICGFWRSLNVVEPDAKALLLTRYADLSVWEASRWWRNSAPSAEASMSRFRRRSDVVHGTVAYPLIPVFADLNSC